nr:MAG TPA: hypothetical protein [Caudoviricetes sp.]
MLDKSSLTRSPEALISACAAVFVIFFKRKLFSSLRSIYSLLR